jgi:signal peptidase I
MLTISLVDIDRDEAGNPKAHFLIKRAAGMGGDYFTSWQGEMFVRFNGENRIVSEREYNAARGWKHRITRLVDEDSYTAAELAGVAAAWIDMRILPTPDMMRAVAVYNEQRYSDVNAFNSQWLEAGSAAFPHERRYSEQLARRKQGWYVPKNHVLPLGDNRDNSHDGRYFGPVPVAKVLGKGSFIYWPPGRLGFLK